MANEFGVNLAIVAQEALASLKTELAPLNAFTVDYSADVAQQGATVSARVMSKSTSTDLSNGYDTAASDIKMDAVSVNLDNFSGVVKRASDLELSKNGKSFENYLVDEIVYAVSSGVLSGVFGKIADSAIITGLTASDAETFTWANTNALLKKLKKAGVKGQKSIILNSDLMAGFRADETVKNMVVYGTANGVDVPTINGFKFYEYPELPATNKLAGLACGKNLVAIATRTPWAPEGFASNGDELAEATDPETGLTVQVRKWYDKSKGCYLISGGIIWGATVIAYPTATTAKEYAGFKILVP